MPISSFAAIPDVMIEVINRNPETVLDCGIGNGMYGTLVKNYLPKCEVFGIEGWDGYRSPNWGNYDMVMIGRMPKALDRIENTFDVILIIDVIEHFEKQEGKAVIEQLKSLLNPSGVLIVSTPAVFCEQGAVGGNELEVHRSLWTAEDLPEFETKRPEGPDKYGHYMQVFTYKKL